jgi:hypothetical protein
VLSALLKESLLWLVSGQAWDANSLALCRRTNLRAEFFPAVSRNRSCANIQRGRRFREHRLHRRARKIPINFLIGILFGMTVSILLRIAAADVSISETGRCLFEWLVRRLQTYLLGRSLGQLAHEGVDLRIAAMALEIGENFLDPVQIRMWLHR